MIEQHTGEQQPDAVQTCRMIPNRRFIDELTSKRNRILRDKTLRWQYNFVAESDSKKKVIKRSINYSDPIIKQSPRKSTDGASCAIEKLSQVTANLLDSPLAKVRLANIPCESPEQD